jgi:hypothetical protein
MIFNRAIFPLPSALLASLLSLFCLPALAESPVYKVEVLVFAHQDAAAMHEQSWSSLEVPHRPGAAQLGNGGSGSYQRLPGSNLVLTAEKNRLARQPGFRTLFHGAWYQPVGNQNSARAVRLRGGQLMPNGAYELDGYISIDRGRFLHLRPDLYYSQSLSTQYANNADNSEDLGSQVLTARLDTPRRMQANEIHYLDNPLFGVLVLIQR